MTKTKEMFLEELDRSIEQADRGELRDANEAIDEICTELEVNGSFYSVIPSNIRCARSHDSRSIIAG